MIKPKVRNLGYHLQFQKIGSPAQIRSKLSYIIDTYCLYVSTFDFIKPISMFDCTIYWESNNSSKFWTEMREWVTKEES